MKHEQLTIRCPHWSDSDEFFRGRCADGKHNGRPSFGECIDLCKECENQRPELDAYIFSLAKQSPSQPVKHSFKDLVAHFTASIGKWSRHGFPLAEKAEYLWRKQQCLLRCGDYWRCPECGCCVRAKAWLATEECPRGHWENYPGDGMVSVLIAHRGEPTENLERTIDSVKTMATGPVEVLTWNDASGHGRRDITNRLSQVAKGDYLFFIDSHCAMSEGWDVLLKSLCTPDQVACSVLANLDDKTWKIGDRHHKGCHLNEKLEIKWNKHMTERDIQPVMAFAGCGWMIQRDLFLEFGGWDEDLARLGWGNEGAEWSLKLGLAGKRILLHPSVVCGHLWQTNKDNILYKIEGGSVESGRDILINKTLLKEWPQQQYDLKCLFEKFGVSLA